MTLFDERERAEELFFVRNQELAFIAHCRAVRRFGTNASERLGLDGATARDYSDALVDSLAHGATDETVIGRVHADLAENGIGSEIGELRAELNRLRALVTSEIKERSARATDIARS